MSDLRFRVGCSLDGSFDVAFRSIVTSAKKARQQIASELNAGAQFQGPYRTNARGAQEAIESVGRTAKQQADAMVRDVQRAARERVRIDREAMREVERDLRNHEAEKARERKRADGDAAREARKNDTYGRRMGGAAITSLYGTARFGARVAGDIARGAGVDTSVGSLVHKSVEKEQLATSLAIQGFKSWGKAGTAEATKQDPRALIGEANAAGNAVAMDPNDVLKAMTRFVDLTGDLQTARGVIVDLGKMSNATGSDLQDMTSAAAAISVQLDASFGEDKQGKIKSMNAILRNLAAQGKEGAVEIKQYASQMSKVAAAAGAFGGNREEVFNLVGMVVQESRKRGGSTTATQAATSVAALARDLTKDSARLESKEGLSVFTDKSHRFLQSPEKIIEAAILKTNGDEEHLRKIFKNSMSFRAVQGFALTYNLAEANKKGSGKAALEEEFKTLRGAMLKQDDVEQANAQTLETTRAKAQLFQNKLQEVADKTSEQLLPALNELAPSALNVAKVFGDVATWTAKNPKEAIALAFTASIAKASIETSLRTGIEQVFAGAAGKNLGAGLAITAAAVTIYFTGKALIDADAAALGAKNAASVGTSLNAVNSVSELNAAKTLTPEQLAQKEAEARALKNTIAKEKAELGDRGYESTTQNIAAHAMGLIDPAEEKSMRADLLRSHEQTLKAHMDALRDLERAIKANTGKVVQRPPPAPATNVTPGHPGAR